MSENEIGFEVLREVARISTSTLDLDTVLARTIDVIKNRMNIDALSIYLFDQDGEEPRLKLRASIGLPEQGARNIFLKPGAGVTGWVAKNKVSLALSEALKDPRFVYFPEIEEEKFQSMLSVPLLDQDECIGVINVHTLDKREFSHTEIAILETISGQITGSIRNAIAYQKSQKLLKEQTLLYDISMAVQEAPKLDHRLWILMTGITHGEAGGFNRAILLLVDEKEQVLRGYMGLGPDSPEDANRIWSELSHHEGDALLWILSESNREAYKQSRFNAFAQSLEIPLRPGEHILAETVLRKQPFIVQDARQEPLAPPEFVEALGVESFATIPLQPQQDVLGVLLVDNRYDGEPINESNLRMVHRLATHLAWVIENSRLFTKLLESNRELLSTKELLIQSEKLAALGELSAEVAHEIKNPLVSIGGFARRLHDQLEKLSKEPGFSKSLEGPREYSAIILKEVNRLESLLKNILLFSKVDQLEPEDCNVPDLMREVLAFFEMEINERGIELNLDICRDPVPLYVDRKKIKQVLINIIFNAIESMPNGGTLTITCTPQEYINGQYMLCLAVEDTGGGIPPETFENIFNPFFSTKESGTGLGLSISRKIIESHGGFIQVKNNVQKGVTVYLYLPLQKFCDYNKN